MALSTYKKQADDTGTDFTIDVVAGSSAVAGVTLIEVGGAHVVVSPSNPYPVDLRTLAGTAISTGNGTVDEGTQRVTIASDSTGVIAITDNGGSITVDNGGTFAVQAAQSGTWNVGTLTSITNTVSVKGANTVSNDAYPITIAGAVETATLNLVYTGSGWARMRGDATNGVLVNLGANNDVTVSGTVTVDGSGVTQPVSAASLPLPTGAATSANQSTANTALSAIQTAVEIIDNIVSGSEAQVDIVAALPSGTNTIGKVNVPAVATGGSTPGKLVSAATTNATSVKASAGTLYSLSVGNTNASPRYLKLYNKASAPTVGTDVPVWTHMIPGASAGSGREVVIPVCGINFSTGIALALTTGAADSDTGAVAAEEITVNYSYT